MKIYQGERINPRDTWLGEWVVTVNHTPLKNPKPEEGGFGWGYSGTGPYNLARAILTDCLGHNGGTANIYEPKERHISPYFLPRHHDKATK